MAEPLNTHPDAAALAASGDEHATEAALAELAALRAQVARLSLIAEQAAASAAVQGMRAGAQGGQAHALRAQVEAMRRSFFWRLTLPLRLAVDVARGIPPTASAEALLLRRGLGLLRREGVAAAWDKLQRYRRTQAMSAAAAKSLRAGGRPAGASAGVTQRAGASAGGPPPVDPRTILAPGVLIVAELTLQQCAKYRVWQKQELFAQLGHPCRVVDWRRRQACLAAASLATQVIFYRVPGYPNVLDMIARMRAMGLSLAWEVDDLIFDRALFLQNRNVDSLEPEMREGILSGVELYRGAMLACGRGIASTPHLAALMRGAGLSETAVVENALDGQTLTLAAELRARRTGRAARTEVLITYGSGTKTHDADFREAAPALLRLLAARPQVRLRIVGELRLPAGFDTLGDRVERLGPVPFARYLALLADSDIGIAPLENTVFNDAKSNIKFLEAAILGIPTVCSPRAHFTDAISCGQNGLLADDDEAWFAQLARLADDAALRARMGGAALALALARYAPEEVARAQVAPLCAPDLRRQPRLRVLFANIYFAPRSYGGATLVVEEMARRLHARGDVDVHVFTGLDPRAEEAVLTRRDDGGITVFEVPGTDTDMVGSFDNPATGAAFGDVLDAVQPDVVHLHAIQGLSASLAAACTARAIPYIITLHDSWWLCERQFMVREDGGYCFQTKIDLHVCQNCVPGAYHLEQRARLLHAALRNAALLLAPSQSHRDIYLANGIAPAQIEVAPNGVRLPAGRAPRAARGALRFAYVGGNVEVKGFSLVKRAFASLARADWELVVVDNTLNLGFTSMDPTQWTGKGKISIVPAYTQDGIDAFFAGIDVLLFPSQWKESFGLTVREALARDVWVIATAGGGPAEAIAPGVNGTLIEMDGRPEGLAAAIEAALDMPALRGGYRNPQADAIMGYAAQAEALYATLRRVAASARQQGPMTDGF